MLCLLPMRVCVWAKKEKKKQLNLTEKESLESGKEKQKGSRKHAAKSKKENNRLSKKYRK